MIFYVRSVIRIFDAFLFLNFDFFFKSSGSTFLNCKYFRICVCGKLANLTVCRVHKDQLTICERIFAFVNAEDYKPVWKYAILYVDSTTAHLCDSSGVFKIVL